MLNRTKKVAAVVVVAALFAAAGLSAGADDNQAPQKGSIEAFQQKVDKIAQERGILAPDVKHVLESENKHQQKLAKARAKYKESPIEGIVELDADKVRVIQGKDGNLLYLIGNGRYAMTGTLIDVWEKKRLLTLKDIVASKTRMNLQTLGLNVKELNTLTVGSGKETATLFVDPRCGWCHKMLEELTVGADLSAQGKDGNSLLAQYTFDIVVAGIMGDASKKLASRINCASVSDREKLDALVKVPASIESLKQTDKCDNKPVQLTALNLQLLGVRGVPVVIAPDWRYQRGKPNNLADFLSGKEMAGTDDPEALARLAREQAKQMLAPQS